MSFTKTDLSVFIQQEGQPRKYIWDMGIEDKEIFPFDAEEEVALVVCLMRDEADGTILDYEPTFTMADNIALVKVEGDQVGWAMDGLYELKVTFTDLSEERVWSKTLAIRVVA
jgi:hypothetical protein